MQTGLSFESKNKALISSAETILDSLNTAVLVVTRTGAIKYRNRAAAADLPAGESIEHAFAEAKILGTFDGWQKVIARVIERGAGAEFDCAFPQAEHRAPSLGRARFAPITPPRNEAPVEIVVTLDAPAPSATAEQRLEVSQRLASLGKLATRVAHELNNPLDGILRYVNLALRLTADADEPKLRSYLSESRTGLMRMVQIIGDLLEFSRATNGEFHDAGINEVVEQAIRNLSSAADEAEVIIAADFQCRDLPVLHGGRLYQVCCNLIKNAIEAMPHGGRLSITTGVVEENFVIQVADTGVGLPQPIDRVFEPFFTTKMPGKGSGLGLAICKDLIEDVQGAITAAPGAEGGAVFTIRIPSGPRPPRANHHPSGRP